MFEVSLLGWMDGVDGDEANQTKQTGETRDKERGYV